MKIGVTQIVYSKVLVEKIMVHICSGLVSTTKIMLYNEPPPKPLPRVNFLGTHVLYCSKHTHMM